MRRHHGLSCFVVILMAFTACSGGEGEGFLSRAPEASSEPEGGPFCGPLEELMDARLALIRRATSNLEIESIIAAIERFQQEIASQAPAELREQVQFTNQVYGRYAQTVLNDGYGKAPFADLTTDEFNEAELALTRFCFQNPTR